VLTRPAKDRRTRVVWSEKKWRSPKRVWSGVCADFWWIFKQHGGNHLGKQVRRFCVVGRELMVRNSQQVDEVTGRGAGK